MSNCFCNRFQGKNMVVIGGTSGIGKEVCLRAGKEGAFVVVVGRNEERGNEIVQDINDNNGKARFIQTDISKEDEVLNLFDVINKEVGDIDVLINNAGVLCRGERIDELSTDEWMRLINTNLNGMFYCTREASKNMINHGKGGAIVNTSSIVGKVALHRSSAYVASKHGVNGLTKAVAYDLAKFNIRCNAVSPAGVETPLTAQSSLEVRAQIGKSMAAGMSLDEARVDTMVGMKSENMQKKSAQPHEQASTILYMASDEASHITGSIVMSDAGYTAY